MVEYPKLILLNSAAVAEGIAKQGSNKRSNPKFAVPDFFIVLPSLFIAARD
jgi:hypothetical protein